MHNIIKTDACGRGFINLLFIKISNAQIALIEPGPKTGWPAVLEILELFLNFIGS